MLFRDRLQLAFVFADALCQGADRLKDGPKRAGQSASGQSASGMCSAALLWKLLAFALGQAMSEGLEGSPNRD